MSDIVKVSIENHVAQVRLNRPEKMNALNPDMFIAIAEAGRSINGNKDVRAVILTGEGGAFSAGLDLDTLDMPEEWLEIFRTGSESYPNIFQRPGYVWKQLHCPVICAMQGVAIGGGFQIAMGADIRIAHPQTKMSVREIVWGLIPDMSISQTLRDLVRIDVAKELTYTGRIFEAEEGAKLGLVTRLSEKPLEDAMQMAEQIASSNPDAIFSSKKLFNDAWHGDDLAGLKLEERLQAGVISKPNQLEAVAAVMEKRKPTFTA